MTDEYPQVGEVYKYKGMTGTDEYHGKVVVADVWREVGRVRVLNLIEQEDSMSIASFLWWYVKI